MLSDILGRELVTVDTLDASARGAALLGGIVSGIWADAAATASVAPQMDTVVSSNAKQALAYDEVYARYQRLSEAISVTM
jgi:sugar (pentulose or hexulose) kinase